MFVMRNKLKQQLIIQWKLENKINLHCCKFVFKLIVSNFKYSFKDSKLFTKSIWNKKQSEKEDREEW